MTPDEVRNVTFHATWWRGYVPREVDGLLERVAIQLEARQSPVVTVEQTQLRTTHRGYNIQEVNRIFDRLKGVPFEPEDHIFPSRAERSVPEVVVRVLVGLGVLAGLAGYILYRVEPKSQHGLWEVVGFTGLAVLVLWQTFMKLTSTTAFESGFDVRYFLLGAAFFLGGFGGLVTHLDSLSLVNGVAWTALGLVGGVFLYAEYRDFRLRGDDPPRLGAHDGHLSRRRSEGEHARRS